MPELHSSAPTGKQVHTMVAHLDAVTSLAVDPNGLYLLSGSMINIRFHTVQLSIEGILVVELFLPGLLKIECCTHVTGDYFS